MELWWLAVAVTVAAVLLAAYGSWTAGRLDRLHRRAATARAALETELARRSGLVAELAGSGVLDPAASQLLLDAAHRARLAGDEAREQCESALTRAIAATVGGSPARTGGGGSIQAAELGPWAGELGPWAAEMGPWAEELATVMRRVQLARRFHNDIVVSTQELRGRRLVRWFRLAGHAPMPRTIELEDGG